MAFNIIIKPIALVDVEDAMLWYDLKSKGLAKRFFNSFEGSIEKIQQNPTAYRTITQDVRRCLIKNFPYKIFYKITSDTIYILGVLHAKRSDAFARRRVKLL